MDRAELVDRLDAEFDGSDSALRAVSRQACDLAASNAFDDAVEYDLSVDSVIEHLGDAPEDYSLLERWNWWIGSLELAYGGEFHRFRVRPDLE